MTMKPTTVTVRRDPADIVVIVLVALLIGGAWGAFVGWQWHECAACERLHVEDMDGRQAK